MSTEIEKSYWNENGLYQEESDILQKLVPSTGKSHDTRIELLRCANNIYYDMFNNGMCNCVDGSRSEEYDLVASQVKMGYVEDFMEVYREEQENSDEYDESRSESMYSKACDGMDLVMDRVIEKILSDTKGLACEKELKELEN